MRPKHNLYIESNVHVLALLSQASTVAHAAMLIPTLQIGSAPWRSGHLYQAVQDWLLAIDPRTEKANLSIHLNICINIHGYMCIYT